MQETELLEPPAKRVYDLVKDHHHAFDNALEKLVHAQPVLKVVLQNVMLTNIILYQTIINYM